NMWVTLPVNAGDDYITQFATYVQQNLDPDLKVYVEWGNEVWNGGNVFEWNWIENYGAANGLGHPQATADLTTHCFHLFRQFFAGQTDRMVGVVASHFPHPEIRAAELRRIIATADPSDPNHGFDAVAGAPYFTPDNGQFNAQTTVGDIEAAMRAVIT